VFSDHDLLIKGLKLWRFDNTVSEFWAYFHRACAETATEELPVKNLTPPFAPATSISYKTDAFPLPRDVYWIYSMFWCYYVAWPWPLTFWPWECVMYSASHVWPTYQFLLFYEYRLLSYEYRIYDHISVIWNSHCACAVTWSLTGGKNSQHFWNLWPQFAYSLSHFHGATTKIKPCYSKK